MDAVQVMQFLQEWRGTAPATTAAATAIASDAAGASGLPGSAASYAGSMASFVQDRIGSLYHLAKYILMQAFWYTLSPFPLMCFGVAFILNRSIVFSSTREEVKLQWPWRLALRGVAIISLLLNIPNLAASLLGWEAHRRASKLLWDMHWAISLSYFMELFCATIQHDSPYFDSGFSLFEFSLMFQEVPMQGNVPKEIAVLCLLAILAQVMIHLEGLFKAQNYRLFPSTFVSTLFLAFFIYELYTGSLWHYSTLAVFSLLRFTPQIVIIVVLAFCWSIYGFAAIVTGSKANLNMSSDQSIQFSAADSFYNALVKLGISALVTMPNSHYLAAAGTVYKPLGTWIDRLSVGPRPIVENPYGVEDKMAMPATTQMENLYTDSRTVAIWKPLYARLRVAYRIARAALTVVYCRWNGLQVSKPAPDVLRLISSRIYEQLDSGDPAAHLDLLTQGDLPEIDDSLDYIPDSEYETSSDSSDDESVDSIDAIVERLQREQQMARRRYEALVRPEWELFKLVAARRTGDNPQMCVVCLENQRTILLWPCRCLAICENCRSSLSLQQYKDCICCRRPVTSYSRVFTP